MRTISTKRLRIKTVEDGRYSIIWGDALIGDVVRVDDYQHEARINGFSERSVSAFSAAKLTLSRFPRIVPAPVKVSRRRAA